jgi:hypothetical protein
MTDFYGFATAACCQNRVVFQGLARNTPMNPLRAIFLKLAVEFRAQRLGRRSLREIQFAKYKVAPQRGERSVRERLLRRLPRRLEAAPTPALRTS